MPTEYDKTIQRLWWKATIGYDDMREAAEFEARVAALIAELYADKFADVVLKHARLQVEEEMDAVIQAKDKAIQNFR